MLHNVRWKTQYKQYSTSCIDFLIWFSVVSLWELVLMNHRRYMWRPPVLNQNVSKSFHMELPNYLCCSPYLFHGYIYQTLYIRIYFAAHAAHFRMIVIIILCHVLCISHNIMPRSFYLTPYRIKSICSYHLKFIFILHFTPI